MKKHYDFSTMKSRKNPYAAKLKKPVSIRLNPQTIEYFKNLAVETGMPYQRIINRYLDDCVAHQIRLN
jgi:predicted DNA binding CopG/RHH family protein